ncbi:hypothetical protein BGZ94_004675 [Podila epigama]|nr:hypothetical protein BGZ94_004675 [Podila epigama]
MSTSPTESDLAAASKNDARESQSSTLTNTNATSNLGGVMNTNSGHIQTSKRKKGDDFKAKGEAQQDARSFDMQKQTPNDLETSQHGPPLNTTASVSMQEGTQGKHDNIAGDASIQKSTIMMKRLRSKSESKLPGRGKGKSTGTDTNTITIGQAR